MRHLPLLLIFAVSHLAASAQEKELLTVAERSGFTRTARYAEVESLIARYVARGRHLKRADFGKTNDGRAMSAVIVGKNPDQPAGRLTALLLGNIHSGECAGKEALLMLLRELALDPQHPLLKRLILIVVPNYNADGNERMGKAHRPGQVGPTAGMGLRTNAQGLDLNRDFLKLEAPETRALVTLLNRHNPHLFIDCHTTNGSRHRYPLTYDIPHNPAAPADVRQFLRGEMMPAVTRTLARQKLDTFYYGNFDRAKTRWNSFGHEGRYSTEYVGLRGRLSILAEAYSYLPYEKRIRATLRFVRACLQYVHAHHQRVRRLLAGVVSERRIPMQSKMTAFTTPVTIKGYDEQGRPADHKVRFFGNFVPTRQIVRPRAYWIPREESRLVARLKMHGIRVDVLTAQARLRCEAYRVTQLTRARKPFQNHRLLKLQVTGRALTRTLPAGSYLIRTEQPLGRLAAVLLEPSSDDSLLTWNFLDHVLQKGREIPILRLLDVGELPASKPLERVTPAQQLTLDQIYGPSGRVPFSGTGRPRVSWIKDTSTYRRQQDRRSWAVEASSGAMTRIASNRPILVAAFQAIKGISASTAARMAATARNSPDGHWVLARHDNDLWVYDTRKKSARRTTFDKAPEQDPTFSPDSTRVAYTRQHNLHVLELATGRERAMTTKGHALLPHGRLDWVYQEELYGRGRFRAFWWSPDSKRLAFLRLDESPVKTFNVTDNIPVRQKIEVMRYPKAGDPNPQVALGISHVDSGKIIWVDHGPFAKIEHLIVRVGWSPRGARVVYQLQDRRQTWLSLRSANPDTGVNTELLRETSKAWVSSRGHPRWLADDSFLWISERTGNRHLYHVSVDGKRIRPITKGDYDVRKVLGLDSQRKLVYFISTRDSPIALNAYRVPLAGGAVQRLTSGAGSHQVQFDKKFTHFIDTVSSAHRPSQVVLRRADGTLVRTIDPNPPDHLTHYNLNPAEFLEVPTGDGGAMQAMMIKPPDFDPQKRYPVMCYLYGGPMAASVWNRWGGKTYLWHQYLAQQGYVIWICDNRSATTRGIKQAWPIYRNLGQTELRDIEAGLRWLTAKPWIDPGRIGIWGWSYGGYIASYALTHSKMFKLGIAGAPVTDWRNYDSIYTERYMDLPQNNPKGYDSSSVVRAAANLRGKLLIIHGEMDDNVHLSNTMQLAHALQAANKTFQLMIYPRSRHGIQSRHKIDLMTRFILNNL